MPNITIITKKNNKKDKANETLQTIPSDIKEKTITSSNGLFRGFRNLKMESAPIIPKERAMFPEIVFVIT